MKRKRKLNKVKKKRSNTQAITSAEKKIFIGVWTQTIGQITEGIGLAEQLFEKTAKKKVKPFSGTHLTGAEKALIGVWIQATGNFLESVGVTKQLSSDLNIQVEGRLLSVKGNWLQAFGASLGAIGGTQELAEDYPQVTFTI